MSCLSRKIQQKRSESLPTKTRRKCDNHHPQHVCHRHQHPIIRRHNTIEPIYASQDYADVSEVKRKGYRASLNIPLDTIAHILPTLSDRPRRDINSDNDTEQNDTPGYRLVDREADTCTLPCSPCQPATLPSDRDVTSVRSDNYDSRNQPQLRSLMIMYSNATRRKQPIDLLAWSARYFYALSNGEHLYQKPKFIKPKSSSTQFSPTVIGNLHNRLGHEVSVTVDQLREAWADMKLDKELLQSLIQQTKTVNRVTWLKLLSAMSSRVAAEIDRSMLLCLTVLASCGTATRVRLSDFHSIYAYHGELYEGQSVRTLVRMMAWLEDKADIDTGYIAIEDLAI